MSLWYHYILKLSILTYLSFSWTGAVIDKKAFDTYAEAGSGEKLRDYLNTITGE